MSKRIGLLTGGGDAPGQNVCLKAIVYGAVDCGYEVIGIRKGWEGLLHYDPDNPDSHAEHVMTLTKPRVRDIDRLTGGYLHSSRLDPGAVPADSVPAFLAQPDRAASGPTNPDAQGREAPAQQLRPVASHNGAAPCPLDLTRHLLRVVDSLKLSAVVVLGDRAVLNYAARLSREGVPVIGIPKTVHNNICGSDYALGFSTAVGRGVHFVHEMRAMAGSREEIAVVEILGRTAGLTTMLISLLAGADRTLIPEVPFDPQQLASLLAQDKHANPNNYAILVMSEATQVLSETARTYLPELSRLANSRALSEAMEAQGREAAEDRILNVLAGEREMGARVSGSGPVVTEILENLLGERMLFQPLSYLIRTGEPDGQDLLGAMNFAASAVRLLSSGKAGRLVAYRHKENYVDLPIAVVTEGETNIKVADYYDAGAYYPKPGILWAARI